MHAVAVKTAARCLKQNFEVVPPDVIGSHQGFRDRIAEKVG